jgi:hypothetical protein
MKKVIVLLLSVLSFQCLAQTTLPLIDEEKTTKGTLCIYGNSQQTETYTVSKGYQCPSIKTFK